MKRRTKNLVFLLAVIFGAVGVGSGIKMEGASGLSYQSKVGVQFTFEPTISVSLSSADLVIDNLAPGTSADSNEIKVSVSSNAAYGYHLSATAGTSSTNTNLVNSSNNNYIFTSLATTASTLADFGENYWGYSYCADTATNCGEGGSATWVSGDVDSAKTGYAGLPLDNDDNGETGVTLMDTNSNADSSVQFKIGAKASSTQASGTYTNTINFYAVTNPAPDFLYDTIAAMSKGKQTAADLQAALTTPTSTDRSKDTSNSGVYEYDPNVFGLSSDASNDYAIYYYRGILETDPGTYGSAGSANTYPNYVKLSNNTCWRIVRTTGSGGVKMIYNGTWKNNTCANSQGNAQVTTQAFNSTYTGAVYVGYTYNSAIASSTTSTDVNTVFGSNTNLDANNTRSTIKTYIEDTWYKGTMGDSYTSKLEANAGYCSDRTVYNTSGSLLSSIVPKQNVQVNFGARVRVGYQSTIKTPTLECPRGDVDIYRYVASSSGTKNELKYPAALLTADEATLAGSGYSGITAYSGLSYLRSGSSFWLLSPSNRNSNGYASGFRVNGTGTLNYDYVSNSYGVRPAISLTPGTMITGGTGTATSPWTVE